MSIWQNDNNGIKNWQHTQHSPQAQPAPKPLPQPDLSNAANERMFLYPGGPLLTGDLLAKLQKPALRQDTQQPEFPEFNEKGYKQNLDSNS